MKPLPKSYQASEKTVSVKIEGEYYEVANLKKSGIVNQTTILLAFNDIWHQVNVLNLGADDSNLENFKTHVELHQYKLKDFGIINKEKEQTVKYEPKHEDFMKLEAEFPAFSYIKIAKLYDYCIKNSDHYGEIVFKQDLKRLTQRNQTIDQYIDWLQSQKKENINNSKPKFLTMKTLEELKQRTEQREFQLYKLGVLAQEPGNDYTGFGFTITQVSVETDSDQDWSELLERINKAKNPVELTENQQIEAVMEVETTDTNQYIHDRIAEITEMGFETSDGVEYVHPISCAQIPIASITDMDFPQWFDLMKFVNSQTNEDTAQVHEAKPITEAAAAEPAKKKPPVSLEVIGTLAPDRITELHELAAAQDKVLLENPLIEVKDAETLKKAKASVSILLKASTNIDGTKGIKANKNRFLKQLSTTIDSFLDPLAKKTRDRYDKLKARVDAYENAEAEKVLQAQKDKVAKINARTAELFAVPMVFNGELYTIGTLHILPSQVESTTDEDFASLIKQAQEIKTAIDAEANAVDPVTLAMAKKLAVIEGKTVEVVLEEMAAEVEALKTQPTAAQEEKATPAPVQTPAPAQTASVASAPARTTFTPSTAPAATPEKTVKVIWEPETVFVNADPKNTILVALDQENAHALAHPGYIKVRAYYKRGTKDMAAQIRAIFASDHPKKSDAIKELLEIIEKS